MLLFYNAFAATVNSMGAASAESGVMADRKQLEAKLIEHLEAAHLCDVLVRSVHHDIERQLDAGR